MMNSTVHDDDYDDNDCDNDAGGCNNDGSTGNQNIKPQSHIQDFGPGRAKVHPDLASR